MSQTLAYSIKNRVVLITGANRGIGKSLVDAVIQRGAAKVYAAVRTLDTAKSLTEQYNGKVFTLHVDLNQPETIQNAAKEATDVHIIINSAGIVSRNGPLDDNAVINLQELMQVNVYSLMQIGQNFAPILKQNGGGVLCQLNSVASIRIANMKQSNYGASKAAAFSVTQGLRHALQEQNTLVVSVQPGPTKTDMIATADDVTKAMAESPNDTANDICNAIETGQFLCFPGSNAKGLSDAFQSYATYVFDEGNAY